MELDLGSNPAVVLLYGKETDYVFHCAGVSQHREHLPDDYSHLEDTVAIQTNMKRAESLPEPIYGPM